MLVLTKDGAVIIEHEILVLNFNFANRLRELLLGM